MKRLAAALLIAFSGAAFGQAAEVDKPDAATENRLKTLAEELRCLVCQNQTIADSNAPLAVDLRNQIRGQIGAGRSDDQIRSYMVERYGDFVLYRPPFKATTAVLWLGPLLLVLVGVGVFFVVVRRKPDAAPVEAAPPPRRAEIEALLEGDAHASPPQDGEPAPSAHRASPKKKRPAKGRS
jgi:cytochrome c-type biogenesis protein CcmH